MVWFSRSPMVLMDFIIDSALLKIQSGCVLNILKKLICGLPYRNLGYFFDENLSVERYLNLIWFHCCICRRVKRMIEIFLIKECTFNKMANRCIFFEMFEVIQTIFVQKCVSLQGAIDWGPGSPNLTPLNFFMWSVKSV